MDMTEYLEPMEDEGAKNARLELRSTEKQKQILEIAASVVGQSLTGFVLAAAVERALGIIREHAATTLSLRDWKALQELIANPPAPNNALKAAVARHRKLVRSDA
jgi:uncharacterized protein (DUF1778 family)